jgi:hypothetical protein
MEVMVTSAPACEMDALGHGGHGDFRSGTAQQIHWGDGFDFFKSIGQQAKNTLSHSAP